jgi:hypothetical protein
MNWSNVIKEIQGYGLTQSEIATSVETSQGHISDLSTGKHGGRVGYQLGLNLISLRDKLARRAKRAA